MSRYIFDPADEAEFEMIMKQARRDASAFGITQKFTAYLDQFEPQERMQQIIAMVAAHARALKITTPRHSPILKDSAKKISANHCGEIQRFPTAV